MLFGLLRPIGVGLGSEGSDYSLVMHTGPDDVYDRLTDVGQRHAVIAAREAERAFVCLWTRTEGLSDRGGKIFEDALHLFAFTACLRLPEGGAVATAYIANAAFWSLFDLNERAKEYAKEAA